MAIADYIDGCRLSRLLQAVEKVKDGQESVRLLRHVQSAKSQECQGSCRLPKQLQTKNYVKENMFFTIFTYLTTKTQFCVVPTKTYGTCCPFSLPNTN